MRTVGVLALALLVSASVPGKDEARKPKWSVADSGAKDDLHGVAFVDERIGVAVGANRTILRTIDGGKTWKRVLGPVKEDDYFADVVFGDGKTGHVRGSYTGNLHRTRDAGAKWEAFDNPNPSGLYSIKGFSAHAARGGSYFWMNYAGSFSTLALYRTDNARAWTKLWNHDNDTLGGSGASMAFTDAKDGWMASTTHPGAKFWVGRTSDGGKTWKAREIKEKVRGGYMLVQAIDKDTGWFASGVGKWVHATTDGGKTWQAHDLGLGESNTVARLRFLDAKTGYALCGKPWHVRKTTDGGKSWKSLGLLAPPDAAYGMAFTPGGTGIVVGAKGYIARYGE